VEGQAVFSIRSSRWVCSIVLVLAPAPGAAAGDWPMWRYDAARTAASPAGIPHQLHLQWVRHFTPPEPVWDDPLNQDLMPYDKVFEPVVMGKTVFVGFNESDKIVALDTDTGGQRWVFYADGPLRLPPVAGEGKVIFACDDGCLYCLDAFSGKLRWKFRGGPSDRKLLGNKRLISTWPARGGPVLEGGRVYFAASIWPFMGTFIYALDAETGKVIWENDRTGALWTMQPHRYPAFGGVAPQGAFVVTQDRLLVPGGRSVPACFDLHSGEYFYHHMANADKDYSYDKTGGSFVCAAGGVFFNHHREQITSMYDLKTGHQLVHGIGRYPVLTDKTCYTSGGKITAYAIDRIRRNPKEWKSARQWEIAVNASGDLIKAGSRLFAAGDGHITAVDLPANGEEPQVAWTRSIDGKVQRLVAADGRLFAVTLDGRIMAFGAKSLSPRHIKPQTTQAGPSPAAVATAKAILDESGVTEGYALMYGVGDGELLAALALNSSLAIIAIDPDGAKVDALRRRFDAAGLYARRVALHQGDPFTFEAPPYLASLTVVGDLRAAGFEVDEAFLERIFKPMRPYGGRAWIPVKGSTQPGFLNLVKDSKLPGAKAVAGAGGVIVSREGPLPGSAWWTHQYGNVANTAKSDDTLVRMPLGLLWFGGNSNMDVLPRHGHGPSEQIIGGRLFVEGMDCISARDVYTGRVLWKTRLGDLETFGVYYDETYMNTPTSTGYNQIHIPGANVRGTNFVATLDKVYVVKGPDCQVLDAATGKRLHTISLPVQDDGQRPQWGYIGIDEDTLVAGAGVVTLSDLLTKEERKPPDTKDHHLSFYDYDKSASKGLVVMDRNSGRVRWTLPARDGFIHNAIAIANGTLFCLDKLPPYVEQCFRRRGVNSPGAGRLLAMDLGSGEVKWAKTENVFGSWLSYSEQYDVLLQATRPSGDMVRGEEGKRMIAYNGKDGTVLWDVVRSYGNPPIIHGDKIITHGTMYSLLTGEQVHRLSPLTGRRVPWTYLRTKGCGYHIASENLITFRSSSAAYYDLAIDGGTGHFGGFKSGCSANLVAADGLLNAPDYTRTCSCAFQNQTSLALVHMPEVEVWTTFPEFEIDARIQRIGINLGAGGDRKDEYGTLWLEYPVVGGASPMVEVFVGPDVRGTMSSGAETAPAGQQPEWLLHHSSRMEGNGPAWIGASGAEGLTEMTVSLAPGAEDERAYTVRLYFAELRDLPPGQRVFSIQLQGSERLSNFDIAEAAGGPRRTVVREFAGVKVTDELEVRLIPSETSPIRKPLLCGLEAIAAGR